MEEHRYNVILNYDPENSEIHRKVVTALFEKAPLAAQRFEEAKFNGRIIIKRGADLRTAKGYGRLFRDTGAHCSFQKIVPAPAVSEKAMDMADRSPGLNPAPNTPAATVCPNCGHPVLKKDECEACGVIIAKVKTRRAPAPIQAESPVEEAQLLEQNALPRMFKGVERIRQPLEALLRKIQHPLPVEKMTGWAQRVADRLMRCGLVFAIAVILEVGFLTVYKMMWFLYVAAGSGQHFVKSFPEKAEMFQRIADSDPLALGLSTTFTVLYCGLLLGCVAQLLHLIRYLFESQHMIGKFVIWFAPLAGLAAWIVTQQKPFPELALAVLLVALPVLVMLSSCLYLAQTLLPESGEFRKIGAIILDNQGDTWGHIIDKIRKWLDTVKQGR